MELKSETTGGTLYGVEGQLATSGAHRVNSLLWTLDQIDPSRKRSSADALVFSAAVSQRQAIAHVHYYNSEDGKFYMSWIDTFSFAKDIQACRDYTKNVVEWMLEIQQPIIRDAMAKMHPMTRLWKKGRSASTITDAAESFTSEDGRRSKSQRMSEVGSLLDQQASRLVDCPGGRPADRQVGRSTDPQATSLGAIDTSQVASWVAVLGRR